MQWFAETQGASTVKIRFDRYLPVLDWGRRYYRGAFRNDMMAADVVTIMLTLQSPRSFSTLFGTLRALAAGPVAVVSLMTAAVGQVTQQGTAGYAATALTLARLSGLFLLGFIADFLSHPVIAGFIIASGILIATSQLKYVLGVPADCDTLPEMPDALFRHLGPDQPDHADDRADDDRVLVLGLQRVAACPDARGPVRGCGACCQPRRPGCRGCRDDAGGVAISPRPPRRRHRRQRIDPDQELIGLGMANIGAGLAATNR